VSEIRTGLGPWTTALTSIVITFIVIAVSHALIRRLTRNRATTQAAMERTHRPAQFAAFAVVLRVTVPPLLGSWQHPVAAILNVAVVVTVAWLVTAVVLRIEEFTLQRFRVDVADNLAARRVHTQISILRRVTIVVIAVIAVAAALMTFPQARAAGASLLASAGLAGVVAGLAAQSTLGNLFAGLNLAFGNALRLDDVVVVEGEWGRIEEITLTYVVVRIWDQRRLILPSSYFTTTPFQNWTRTSADILGTIELDVDWSVPVDELREAARRVVESSDLWDRRVFGLQITDATGGLVRARVLVSAADSSKLWDLRCLVRERLVTWLQQEHPTALPRTRTELQGALPRLPDPRHPEPA
jgi:small-conductance mechanosensitive channel